MIELTEKDKQQILETIKPAYTVATKSRIDFQKYNTQIIPEEFKRICLCKGNHGQEVQTKRCKYCSHTFSEHDTIYPISFVKDYTKQCDEKGVSKYARNNISNKLSLSNFFFVKKHPTKENAIVIMRINLFVKFPAKGDKEELEFKIVSESEIIPGEDSLCYKPGKTGDTPTDMFDTFKISSYLTKYGATIIYEDSKGLIDFMLKNKKFAQFTGFLETFNMIEVNVPRNAFFLYYIYIYSQYPVVEFVIKMGYIKLLSDIFNNITQGVNRESIKTSIQQLNKILNAESHRGSMAFTVPKYISDSLNERGDGAYIFRLWGDIYQLCPISKENYYKVIDSDVYYDIAFGARADDVIANIMKFGYNIMDLISYMEKQKKILDASTYQVINYMKDYLNMCDLMEVEPERFPGNIRKAHDNCQKAFSAKQNVLTDKSIKKLAEIATPFIPDTQKYHESQYFITIPTCTSDIVQEAQHQHNCCGSYCGAVAKHATLLFFIRKKDYPEDSLVTAEYRYGRLNQIFYKNNRPVHDKEILEMAEDFVRKLNNSRTNILSKY